MDTTLAGTSVLRFDDVGLVVEQWDTWNTVPSAKIHPPMGPLSRVERSTPIFR